MDCGAGGKFIDQNYTRMKGIKMEALKEPIQVYNVDGTPNKRGTIRYYVLRLQTIKATVDSRSFKSPKSDEPRRVQVLDLYCLTRFESKSSSKGIVY